LFIAKSGPGQGKKVPKLVKGGHIAPLPRMLFLLSGNAVQSPCQLHLRHPQQLGGAYVT
jgi:hypothetical protein